MITYIKINGFKSFHNFEMTFTPLTIIAGTNASGKSNLFDALKLLSKLAETDNIKKTFTKEQRGEFVELFTQYDDGKYAEEMTFTVEMLVNKNVRDAWGNSSSLKYTRLRYELAIRRFTNNFGLDDIEVIHENLVKLDHKDDKWIHIIPQDNREQWRPKVVTGKRGTQYIRTTQENNILTVEVPQDGTTGNKRRFPLKNASRTVLSSFDTVDFPHVLAAKEEMKSWRFLQLNPEDLRKPTSKSTGNDQISESGENLAASLNRIKTNNHFLLAEISRKLQSFIPNFIDVMVFDDKENKQYLIKLLDKDKKEYTSRVLSEGTLRVLALCILEYDDLHTGLLCFEEPENGIHPARIATMATLLKDLSTDFSDESFPLRQVIVNTHSPILVRKVEKWKDDPNVSIWLSQISNVITTSISDKKKLKLSISKILPVKKEHEQQLQIFFTDAEMKMTLTKVKEYLETTENL
jgi:predicted ATPase